MAPGNKDLAKLLRLIADISESDQPELISSVLISVRSTRNDFGKRKKADPDHTEKPPLLSNDEIVRLEGFENRDDLGAHLRNLYQRKADVESVARALKISINKTSSYDEVVEKIIDASIGYKLRSRAIRGE
ncbi:hypothetical protein [Agrobacterium rosae]|uniref:hypothetical protein n=1 Tax=Agrobacterium rosae TaxID=1972867 RepID=UPI00122F682E|nr:hypothetical protein [Agrobacterium rosae]KAA3507693.1 hypothetical protein DXM21_24570 [Agrobacterium rosae]KAA3512573.1 hypothetical protein DXM25_24760 [Agrobacterium rosae]MQB51278.1 hypothetical protein [Agrobacterium rosae]